MTFYSNFELADALTVVFVGNASGSNSDGETARLSALPQPTSQDTRALPAAQDTRST